MLVTVLLSRTKPLIRYEMSDSVAISTESCPCGRPFVLLTGIQGRREDTLRLLDARGARVDVQPSVFHRVLETVDVRGWQVVHENDGIRVLLAGAAPSVDVASVQRAIHAALVEAHAVPPPVFIEHVLEIPKSALGKTPLITVDTRTGGPNVVVATAEAVVFGSP